MKTKKSDFHENHELINFRGSIIFNNHAYRNVHSISTISVKINLN